MGVRRRVEGGLGEGGAARGCDPHGVDGDTPRTARGDGIVAANPNWCGTPLDFPVPV
jgi:hypothetical protein